jgi:hypothetical protein
MSASLRWSTAPIALAALFFGVSLGAMPARAAVSVQGDTASVQVVAHQATVSEVLAALRSALGLRYRTMANIDSVIGGTYRGPLNNVLGQILRGYNYVIEVHDTTIYLIVVGKAGKLPVASGVPPVELAPVRSASPPSIDSEVRELRHNKW